MNLKTKMVKLKEFEKVYIAGEVILRFDFVGDRGELARMLFSKISSSSGVEVLSVNLVADETASLAEIREMFSDCSVAKELKSAGIIQTRRRK